MFTVSTNINSKQSKVPDNLRCNPQQVVLEVKQIVRCNTLQVVLGQQADKLSCELHNHIICNLTICVYYTY